MVTIDADAASHDGVTLVTATVAGADAPVRVTIESRLDGPVWPPRRQGEPAAGWTDDGFAGVVPADGSLALGFASPADPVDPPLELVATEPAADPGDDMDSPAAVLRGLGDPTPPSLIEPDSSGGNPDEHADEIAATPEDEQSVDRAPVESVFDTSDPVVTGETTDDLGATQTDDVDDHHTPADLPPAVADWLGAVESRVDDAEALSAGASVDRATAALSACGGVEGAREIDDQLRVDVEKLRTVEERVATLAERTDEATVATDALDRLA